VRGRNLIEVAKPAPPVEDPNRFYRSGESSRVNKGPGFKVWVPADVYPIFEARRESRIRSSGSQYELCNAS
jgi:hypothetical protein